MKPVLTIHNKGTVTLKMEVTDLVSFLSDAALYESSCRCQPNRDWYQTLADQLQEWIRTSDHSKLRDASDADVGDEVRRMYGTKS